MTDQISDADAPGTYDPVRAILDIACTGGDTSVDGMVAVDVALAAIRHALKIGGAMQTEATRIMPAYVEEFLRAVRDHPGQKYPVESYHSPDHEDSRPSWSIAETSGWVRSVGSHKWEMTPAGRIIVGLLDAGLTNPDAGEDEAPAEPFGYWIEQKGAEPSLLRRPAYIPEASDIRTVTPLYAQRSQRDDRTGVGADRATTDWRRLFDEMSKAAGNLKAAIRPQLDAMPYADMPTVRQAFNDVAVVSGRGLDARQAGLEEATPVGHDPIELLRDATMVEYAGGGGWSLNLLFGKGAEGRERTRRASAAIRSALGRYATDSAETA